MGRVSRRMEIAGDHEGLDNRLIEPGDSVGQIAGDFVGDEGLGGLLKYYRRQAA